MRKLLKKFLELESSSSIILLTMTVVAMIFANSPLAYIHERFIDAFLFWINEGLMAIFFLVVGLELKRGFLDNYLSDLSHALLPAIAALGGMLIPALVYLAINYNHPETMRGWATPVATDIAFALGVLSLFGRRIPFPLKLFLLALAIFDDIGAIIIIAFFHTHHLAYGWLLQTALFIFILYLFNLFSIQSLLLYILVGIGLWFCLLKSGVHPTISGVLLALAIPDNGHEQSLLRRLESGLHPWVAYLVMPLFAFANAGFPLTGLTKSIWTDTVFLGIALGLFIGKQVGIFGFSWITIRLKLAKLPENSSWLALYGVATLCGIGFTMSLFLGTLSFQHENIYLAKVRIGVIIGSVISGLMGAYVLSKAFPQKRRSIV